VRLAASDLEPFKAAIAAGVPLIMASHARYPNVDGRNLASQSPALLNDLLRGRLGFRGTVITDSIEARAVTGRSSVAVASQRALLAGADLILMTGDGSFRPVSLSLLARARRDRVFRARVRAAAARVLALKRTLGLAVSPPATP
jgi:beta-N-acetylhexosaminidase